MRHPFRAESGDRRCRAPMRNYATRVGAASRRRRPTGIGRDLVYAASATGSLWRSPLAMMAQAILAILLASAIAATFVGRRAYNALSQGRCFVPWNFG